MTLLIIGFLGFVGFVFVVANWKAKSAMKGYKLDRLKAGKTCPPVPPPQKIIFFFINFFELMDFFL